MKVSDIMTPAALSDAPNDTLAEASAKMWQQQTASLLIMEGEKPKGILPDPEVLRAVAEGTAPRTCNPPDVITANPLTTDPRPTSTTLRRSCSTSGSVTCPSSTPRTRW